jgi:hypothetical protein
MFIYNYIVVAISQELAFFVQGLADYTSKDWGGGFYYSDTLKQMLEENYFDNFPEKYHKELEEIVEFMVAKDVTLAKLNY